MVTKLMLALLVALLVLAGAGYARASTVTLKLMDASPNIIDDGVYVYPYNFSINGSLLETPLLCDDFNDEITFGEMWTATVSTGSADILAAGQMSGAGAVYATLINDRLKAYEDAAWLFQRLLASPPGVNNAAINETIWGLFADTSSHYSAFYHDTLIGNNAWFNQAQADSTVADLDKVTLYTPVPGTQSSGDRPQEFLGAGPLGPMQVSEPSGLMLLGIGLLGLGMMSRKPRLSRIAIE